MGFFFSLTACNSAQAPTQPAVSPSPSATATRTAVPTVTPTPTATPLVDGVKDADLSGRKIRMWHTWTGEVETTLNRLESEFNATNPWGIWVDVEGVSPDGEISESLDAAAQQDNLPDIVVAGAEEAAQWSTAPGLLVDLTPLVQSGEWGFSPTELADIPPLYWDQDVTGEQRWGVPALRSMQVLFYNRTWARELGFPNPPRTLAEFQSQVCAAAQANLNDNDPANDGTGGWIISDDPQAVTAWIDALGGGLIIPGAGENLDLTPVDETFTDLRRMYDRGCAWLARSPDSIGYFKSRQALVYSASLEEIPSVDFALQQAGSSDEWTVLPYPGQGRNPLYLVDGPSYHLLASDPAQEVAAWAFIRFLMDPGHQAQLAEAASALPVSQSAVDQVKSGGHLPAAWTAAADGLDLAVAAPNQPQWRIIRQVLADAHHQLYQSNTKAGDIPKIMDLIQSTLAEIQEREQ